MKKHLFLVASALVALTACNSNQIPDGPVANNEISFKTEITNSTRVAGSNFENGDVISVMATDEADASTVASYTYNGTNFTSTSAFTKEDGEKLSFDAIYPAQTAFATEFDFAVSADQSTAKGYSESDLLVAKTEATASLQPTLSFNHKMSQLVLSFKLTDGTAIVPSAVKVTALASASCDIVANTYVGEGTASQIVAAANGSIGYKAIVAPQTIAPNVDFITMTYNGKTYTAQFSTEAVLASGSQYTYELTADATTQTIVSIDLIDATINDWGQGDVEDPQTDPDPDGEKEYVFDYASLGTTWLNDTEKELAGIVWYLNGVKDSGDYGNIGLSYFNEVGGYMYNKTAFGAGVTEIVVDVKSGENLVVCVGTSENPTTEVTPTVSGTVYTYTVTGSNPYVTIKNNSTGYINLNGITIKYSGETGGTVTPDPDPKPDPTEDTEYVFDYASLGSTWLNDTEKTLGGIVWYLNGVKDSGTYGNIGLSYYNEVGGYMYNKTAFGTGVKEIVVDLKSGENLVVCVGSSENPTTEVTPTVAGTVYTYAVTGTNPYVTIKNNSTGYINLNGITITYAGGEGGSTGGGNEGGNEGEGGGTVTPNPDGDEVTVTVTGADFTHDADPADFNSDKGCPLAAQETVGVFDFDIVSGGTPTRNWWYKEAWQLRLYTGAITTVTCNAGTITSIVLGTTYADDLNFSTEDGGFNTDTWTGSATSVAITCTANSKINQMVITYIAD